MLLHELDEPIPKKVVVDGDWMVYRVGFASEDDPEEFAKARLTELITDIVYFDLRADDYEVYLTGSGNFRESLAVTKPYKGNRDKSKRPRHYQALRDHFVRLGAVIVDGIEADDKVAMRMSEGDFVLCGVDKDLRQIPGWLYNPVKKEIEKITPFEGLRSFYTQLLVGDQADNIQGLRGIGPVKAEKALKDCKDEKQMYETVCEMYEAKGEPMERILENGRLLWLQRKEGDRWSPPV